MGAFFRHQYLPGHPIIYQSWLRRYAYRVLLVTSVFISLRPVYIAFETNNIAAYNAVCENFEFEKCFKMINMIGTTRAYNVYTRVRRWNVTPFNMFRTAVSSRAIKSHLPAVMLDISINLE